VDSPWRVALTFDTEHADRPNEPHGTEHVFAVLAERRVRATAFIQGRWAEAYPDLARRIAHDGHLIGSHSHFHAEMPLLSSDGRRRDLEKAGEAVLEATGVDPRPWFRCPFGAGTHDADVLADITASGYREVRWHVDPADWEPTATTEGVRRAVIEGARRVGDGAVVLMHPWTDGAGGSIAAIVDGLRDEGATFVGVDELETLP
jgi:peptidoglycan/xylan/chitin deacetylase (PgdA/CDA1 family)